MKSFQTCEDLFAYWCRCVFVCVCGCVFPDMFERLKYPKCILHTNLSCQMSKNHTQTMTNGVISCVFVWKFWICFDCIKKGLRTQCYICIWTFTVTNICNIRAEWIPLLPVSSLLSHVSSAGSTLWNQNTSTVQILAINKSSVRDKCHISLCLSQRV